MEESIRPCIEAVKSFSCPMPSENKERKQVQVTFFSVAATYIINNFSELHLFSNQIHTYLSLIIFVTTLSFLLLLILIQSIDSPLQLYVFQTQLRLVSTHDKVLYGLLQNIFSSGFTIAGCSSVS